MRVKTALLEGVTKALSHFGVPAKSAPHVLELLGLGALAAPVAYHMAKSDATPTDRALATVEIGGLGLLGIPSLMKLRH